MKSIYGIFIEDNIKSSRTSEQFSTCKKMVDSFMLMVKSKSKKESQRQVEAYRDIREMEKEAEDLYLQISTALADI